MTLAREAFPPVRTGLAVLAGGGWLIAFLRGALTRPSPAAAAFAASLLLLVVAACVGPFLFGRRVEGEAAWRPAARGGLRALALAGVALAAALAVDGAGFVLAGSTAMFVGLFAFTLAAVADALRGGLAGVAVGAVALLLLGTFFFWDEWFLRTASDRKASAALAFALNPAAAASVTHGFDWMHASELYTGNETAESMVNVPVAGVEAYAGRLAVVAAAAVGVGMWRRG